MEARWMKWLENGAGRLKNAADGFQGRLKHDTFIISKYSVSISSRATS